MLHRKIAELYAGILPFVLVHIVRKILGGVFVHFIVHANSDDSIRGGPILTRPGENGLVPDSAEKKPSSDDTKAKASSTVDRRRECRGAANHPRPHRRVAPRLADPRLVRLDSDLDRDPALDSLSRAELLLRLDRALKVQLPERLIGDANSPNDLVRAILSASPAIAQMARAPDERRRTSKPWKSQ